MMRDSVSQSDIEYRSTEASRLYLGFVRITVNTKKGNILGYGLSGLEDSAECFFEENSSGSIIGTTAYLPENFITHELLTVDPRNEEQVFAFINAYGLLLHPLRSKPGYKNKAIQETNMLVRRLSTIVVSQSEAEETLVMLQETIQQMIDMLIGIGEEWPLLDAINWGRDNPLILQPTSVEPVLFKPQPWANLTSAICNQVIAMFADKADWKFCPICDKPFKRHRPKRLATPRIRQSSKHSDAIYCSEICKRKKYKRPAKTNANNE
jgi:hypothetical protein